MIQSQGYAAQSKTSPLAPYSFEHRDPGPSDIVVEIAYCGICHSDIHQVRDEWGGSMYPMEPGHEKVGRVTAVAPTYNAKHYDGAMAQGGYANAIVVDERYVHTISKKLEPKLAAVAPLLCAGITTYSPLKHWGVGPGKKVGIVGLGGLGHMGLKFAHSFGAHVVLFTTSSGKEADARRLGADEVVLSKDPDAMAKQADSFDFVLDCVSAPHDLNTYLGLLRLDGTLCQVGLPETPLPVGAFSLVKNRRSLSGSMIGGMAETQSMLDYCAEHDIVADIEMVDMDKVNEAYPRVVKGDVKYRFVIDLATL